MSDRLNIYVVDLASIRELISEADETLVEKVLDALAEYLGWDPDEKEEYEEDYEAFAEAARRVLLEKDAVCKDAAWVYTGLTQLADHELVADGWNRNAYAYLAEHCSEYGLSDRAVGLLKAISSGQTPNSQAMSCERDDAVICFFTRDQAVALREELYNSEPLADAADETVQETLFNHLLPALDRDIAENQGFCIA